MFAGNTKLPYGQKPLMLYNGEVSCQTLSGKVHLKQSDLTFVMHTCAHMRVHAHTDTHTHTHLVNISISVYVVFTTYYICHIQIAIVRLATHNHQEEQDLDEAEVKHSYPLPYTFYYTTAAPSFSTKMYYFEKVHTCKPFYGTYI